MHAWFMFTNSLFGITTSYSTSLVSVHIILVYTYGFVILLSCSWGD